MSEVRFPIALARLLTSILSLTSPIFQWPASLYPTKDPVSRIFALYFALSASEMLLNAYCPIANLATHRAQWIED